MKRFIVFIGSTSDSANESSFNYGWNSFGRDFNTQEEAQKWVDKEFTTNFHNIWYQIVDSETRTIISRGGY